MKTSFSVGMPILIAGLFFAPAAAQAPGDGNAPVPLYTNADLARLGPAPTTGETGSARGTASSQEDWLMVQQFLDRQYARIDADRAAERENRLLAPGVDPQHGAWSYSGIWPYYYGGYGSFGARGHDRNPGYRVLPSSLGSRIIQGGHGRYSGLQGSDAYPGAAGRPAGHPHPQPQRHGHR